MSTLFRDRQIDTMTNKLMTSDQSSIKNHIDS